MPCHNSFFWGIWPAPPLGHEEDTFSPIPSGHDEDTFSPILCPFYVGACPSICGFADVKLTEAFSRWLNILLPPAGSEQEDGTWYVREWCVCQPKWLEPGFIPSGASQYSLLSPGTCTSYGVAAGQKESLVIKGVRMEKGKLVYISQASQLDSLPPP